MKEWFAAKTFGYGWYPVTWQGWLVVFLVILDIIFSGLSLTFNPTAEGFFLSFGQIIIAVVLLISICYATGEKAMWRWGKKK